MSNIIVEQPTPPETTPVLPIELTPLMTQEAFVSRLDFLTEFVPIHSARKTNDVIDAAFVRLYGARNVDVRLPLTQQLLLILVSEELLNPDRVAVLLEPISIRSTGAINPITGEITNEPFQQ